MARRKLEDDEDIMDFDEHEDTDFMIDDDNLDGFWDEEEAGSKWEDGDEDIGEDFDEDFDDEDFDEFEDFDDDEEDRD